MAAPGTHISSLGISPEEELQPQSRTQGQAGGDGSEGPARVLSAAQPPGQGRVGSELTTMSLQTEDSVRDE